MESVTATYRGLDHDDPRVEVGLLAIASSNKHRLGKLEPTDARDQCQGSTRTTSQRPVPAERMSMPGSM